ncbi:hypothetical protein [Candidatus Pelagisphaera phototrophica]|uniref:hypothetical protein n=1 Tax=Candidatus Pelagisphaera phototrophica TaxID=2684113 RepID=UPI0019F1DD73|nr:hypothetical protein [Candidatus Pelagisphaera phototrophica]QXD32338.1 hypothetical protein GA004_01005 [Candidatus Pelagisphaera phototrophica]|tara:strand:- start:366 stop:584 length:219 start_codon:yes stop_codon:yes gene_type:complete
MIQPTHSNLQAQSPLRQEYVEELARLEQIESRLGTMLERENDLNIAQEIAHRLSNIQMILAIREGKTSDPGL